MNTKTTKFVEEMFAEGVKRQQEARTLDNEIEMLEWWAKSNDRLAVLLETEHKEERLARSARKTARIARERAEALKANLEATQATAEFMTYLGKASK